MIDLKIDKEQLEATVKRLHERNIIIPTFEQMKNPNRNVPHQIKEELKNISLWEVNPRNLFRITWKNEPFVSGGGYLDLPNYIELPPELTGTEARIIALVGKWMPTGSHKVGATYGCLIPRLVTGQFNPTTQKAVWPSTGNYCRGGAYIATLLACESIAILPEGMSKERFDWLRTVAGEIIATTGTESNVKEIFDKCHELLGSERGKKGEIVIFNQFDEFGNYLFHHEVTGSAMEEILRKELHNDKFRSIGLTTGSSGTLGCGDYLKKVYPSSMIVAGEALQCPTMLLNGYGDHRIEGIGDKHIPWIHNVRNTDMVIAIDDADPMALIRLFNEEAGKKYLKKVGISESIISQLDLLGISSVANVLMAIKTAKYYEMDRNDVILTVFTDSMEMYQSRLLELRNDHGQYTESDAIRDYNNSLMGQTTENMLDLNFLQRRRIHNLKYFTWIEQQGKSLDELNNQWYETETYWQGIRNSIHQIDELIKVTNEKVGLV